VETAARNPVPVFPLPELVLFPHAVIPLHVFELRYRTLVRDALSRGRVLALALLKPGYEADYDGSPEFFRLGCLARFEEVEWLPNDRFNLKVMGLERVRFERIVSEFPYRSARIVTLPEHPYPEDDPLVQIDMRALLELFDRMRDAPPAMTGMEPSKLAPKIGSDLSYACVVNILSTLCGAPARERLALLAEDSVIERGRRLRSILERRLKPKREPPVLPGETGETN